MNSRPVFLLGFGAAKSGTTWLYSYLQSNKLVYFYRTKEPHAWTMYFNPSISKRYYSLINELQGYARSNSENIQNSREKLVIELEQCLLSLKPNTYLEAYINLAKAKNSPVGDLTPDNSRLSQKQMNTVNKFLSKGFEVKSLFMMRDPAHRLFSQFKHTRLRSIGSKLTLNNDINSRIRAHILEEFKDLINSGGSLPETTKVDYVTTIINIDKVFKEENIKYIFFEQLFAEKVVKEICSYLNISYKKAVFSKKINQDPHDIILTEELYYQAKHKLKYVYQFVEERFADTPEEWGKYI